MSLETYRDEDFRQMKKMEKAIIDVLLPFSGHIDPILGLLALLRCARVMFRAASRDAQTKLTPVIVAYLFGKLRPSSSATSKMLWTPGDDTKH